MIETRLRARIAALALPGVEAYFRHLFEDGGLEAEMPRIVGWPETTGQFGGPALFLTGAASHYVRPEHREAIRAHFPHARFARLPGAGHWLHADRPREFEEAVRVFLNA